MAFLGETAQYGWWKTTFLNETGLGFLRIVFPRTACSAAVTAASSGACRVHDERIGRGRVTHLFRLPHRFEAELSERLRTDSEDDIMGILSQESALKFLEETAGTAGEKVEGGPVRLGDAEDLDKPATLSRLAAVYLEGFRAERPVFPYFTESEAKS